MKSDDGTKLLAVNAMKISKYARFGNESVENVGVNKPSEIEKAIRRPTVLSEDNAYKIEI